MGESTPPGLHIVDDTLATQVMALHLLAADAAAAESPPAAIASPPPPDPTAPMLSTSQIALLLSPPAPPPTPSPAPPAPGFYVSTTGSDANAGTLDAPFATLERAQQAMEGSSIKTTYVEGGTYQIASTLTLSSADSGETWQYYPANGVNTAVLDGGGTVDILEADNLTNLTINGIKFQNALDIAVNINNNDSNVTVENCDIGFNHDTSEIGGFAGLLVVNGQNNNVLNNYVHDSLSMGIELFAYTAGTSLDGTHVSGNVVLNTVQQVDDGGAIYVNMRNTNVDGGTVTISDNYVADYGSAATPHARGIYLDDDTSNAIVTGNVIGPPTAAAAQQGLTQAIIVNGGTNDHFSGNIIDLGSTGASWIAGWGISGAGGTLPFTWTAPNVFENNIVISNYAGATHTDYYDWNGGGFDQGAGFPTNMGIIQNNLYYNYGGGEIDTGGNILSDSSPVFANPAITGWDYQLASNSPVSSAIQFTPIAGGWGPPGFTLPTTGAPPSDV